MYKKYLIFLSLLYLNSCAAPTTALFAPSVTAAATESLARASLSYTTNQIVINLKKKKNLHVLIVFEFNSINLLFIKLNLNTSKIFKLI